MQFVATRDVRANPAVLLAEEGTIVMQNGKPRAICFPLEDGDDPLLAEQAWRRARFGIALETLRADAARSGAASLSDEAIDAEIRAARSEATPA